VKTKKPGVKEGGIQEMFVAHVEKISLGAAFVLVLIFLMLFGPKNKGANDKSLRPEAIQNAVAQARRNINNKETWQEASKRLFSGDPDYDVRAKENTAKVPLKDFELQVAWQELYDQPLPKRGDPNLFPLAELEVHAGTAALVLTPDAAGVDGKSAEAAAAIGTQPRLRPEQAMALPHLPKAATGKGIAVGKSFVVVTGLVPYEKQLTEYNQCFIGAAGYQERRDQPRYFYYIVERAEYTQDGKPIPWVDSEGKEHSWRQISSLKLAKTEVDKWAWVYPEPADDLYLDPILTLAPPPLLVKDIPQLMVHSKVPLRAEHRGRDSDPDTKTETKPAPKADSDPFDPLGLGPDVADTPKKTEEKKPEQEKREPVSAKYRLFRFVDFDVAPDKTYQYRVQLFLYDPNNPPPLDSKRAGTRGTSDKEKVAGGPSDAQLQQSVIARRQKCNAGKRRIYWRTTEWSKASKRIGFSNTRQLLVGRVDAGATRSFTIPTANGGQKEVTIRTEPRTASLMVIAWDQEQATYIPGVIEKVQRGSILNFEKDVWVMDLLHHNLRMLKKYFFKTNGIVIDIRGGDPLPTSKENRKTPLLSPGEVLVFDGDGNLVVCNEVEDAKSYRMNFFGDLRSMKKGAAPEDKKEDGEGVLTPGGGLEDADELGAAGREHRGRPASHRGGRRPPPPRR